MYTPIIEFSSLVLFVGCVWHATRYEGRWFAQGWFVAGYLFGIFRETVMQVAFQTVYYDPSILRLGAAPAVVSLLWGSLFYLGYVFARRIVPAGEYVPFATFIFIVTASLVLPIAATAALLGWWTYTGPGPVLFGQMPVTAPAIWGGAAALYYLFFQRIAATRLPARGQVYAMITFSPIIAALHVLYTLLLTALLG